MSKIALLSVSDKSGLKKLLDSLNSFKYHFIASGGTCKFIKENNYDVEEISDYTGFSEMLDGRVKTLHPAIYGGILARQTDKDLTDMNRLGYKYIDIVVCNLYPFEEKASSQNTELSEVLENIDIGGVSLLRAAAKNFKRVSVLCDPADYTTVIDELTANVGSLSEESRQRLALKAFCHTAHYDEVISDYFQTQFKPDTVLPLRYGLNPHQVPASISVNLRHNSSGSMPLKVLNGSPGFVNLCDALNGWQLVSELSAAFDHSIPAAASFKHVSPAGAAIGLPLFDEEVRAYMMSGMELSPLACAYVRARGADRMSSFGDFIALSHCCDVSTAKVIAREVSDGIIAPDYTVEALKILSSKKGGNFCVIKMDRNYHPRDEEIKTIFGLELKQRRNDVVIDAAYFKKCINTSGDCQTIPPDTAIRDLIVATIAVKYTQSNSVCYATNGQVIGIGAGQQSRIHCTRLAGDKADNWWLRHHPKVLNMKFKKEFKRAEINNFIDLYLNIEMKQDLENFAKGFDVVPDPLSSEERQLWIKQMDNVVLSSDAFFPFRDNIDRAVKSGVKFVAAPLGSTNDNSIIKACDEYQVMLFPMSNRLFHH